MVVLLVAALLAALAVRRRQLTRACGFVEASVRRAGHRRWALGIARFGSHRVEWWKVFSLRPRPHLVWERAHFDVLERRWPDGSHGVQVHGPAVMLRCAARGDDLDLAMTADAYTGFASWLEAAPPGPPPTTA